MCPGSSASVCLVEDVVDVAHLADRADFARRRPWQCRRSPARDAAVRTSPGRRASPPPRGRRCQRRRILRGTCRTSATPDWPRPVTSPWSTGQKPTGSHRTSVGPCAARWPSATPFPPPRPAYPPLPSHHREPDAIAAGLSDHRAPELPRRRPPPAGVDPFRRDRDDDARGRLAEQGRRDADTPGWTSAARHVASRRAPPVSKRIPRASPPARLRRSRAPIRPALR